MSYKICYFNKRTFFPALLLAHGESCDVRWLSPDGPSNRQIFLIAHNLPKVYAVWLIESGFEVINQIGNRK